MTTQSLVSKNPKVRTRRISLSDIGIAVLLWGYAAVVLLPLLLVVSNALRPTRDIFKNPVGLPTSPTFNSFVKAWEEASFNIYFFNSLFITVASVLLATVVAALAAYILGRYTFTGSGVLTAYFLAGLMLPFRLAIVPLFLIAEQYGAD